MFGGRILPLEKNMGRPSSGNVFHRLVHRLLGTAGPHPKVGAEWITLR